MTPDVVVDIGNTRIKWGVCSEQCVTEVIRLPLDDSAAWEAARAKLHAPHAQARRWAVASVNPPALQAFAVWASHHGDNAVFERHSDLPIRVNVDEPHSVGLDRLCGAIAARAQVPRGTPAITVDVGTAVTVNLIDSAGAFQGGAIFPGPRLMARSLHEHTAKLPLTEPTADLRDSATPGKNTTNAIRQGILAALRGGVAQLVTVFAEQCPAAPWLFMTGGGAPLIEGMQILGIAESRTVPALNLEGIRIAAEALP